MTRHPTGPAPRSPVIELVKRHPLLHRSLDTIQRRRCAELLDRFADHITDEPVLDVGAGTCHTTALLRAKGADVVALDIVDASLFDDIQPVLYDGSNFPFQDNSFGTAILQTVLHHTSDPERVLVEAARVAHRLIITEDVTRGPVHRWATWAQDSVVNLEFRGHPHSNKTNDEWQNLFERLDLEPVARSATWRLLMWQVTYVLDHHSVGGGGKGRLIRPS